MKNKEHSKYVVAAFRLPEDIHCMVMQLVAEEDIDFSKFVRRALRRELCASHPELEAGGRRQ